MTTIQSVELFTAINTGIVGLSHLLQPTAWVEFFMFLHSKKHTGNIVNAFLALGMGSLILSFHFTWNWPQVIVTVFGAAQVFKGLLYLVKPSIGIKSIGRVRMERANNFRWAGLIMIILSIIIFYWLIKDEAFQ